MKSVSVGVKRLVLRPEGKKKRGNGERKM